MAGLDNTVVNNVKNDCFYTCENDTFNSVYDVNIFDVLTQNDICHDSDNGAILLNGAPNCVLYANCTENCNETTSYFKNSVSCDNH